MGEEMHRKEKRRDELISFYSLSSYGFQLLRFTMIVTPHPFDAHQTWNRKIALSSVKLLQTQEHCSDSEEKETFYTLLRTFKRCIFLSTVL